MAIVDVRETWEGSDAERDASNARQYRRTFQVITNDLRDGPAVVGNTSVTGIPGLYTSFVDAYGNIDRGAVVHSFKPKRRSDDPLIWDVEVLYASRVFNRSPYRQGASGRSGKAEQGDKGQQDTNPLNAPVVIQVDGQKYEKPQATDLDGWSFVNFAGQAFAQSVIDDTRILITMDKNKATIDQGQIGTYKDVLNADFFWGCEPLTLKIHIRAQSAFEEKLKYWKYSYYMEYRQPIPLGAFGASPNGKSIFYQPSGSTIWPQPGDPNGPSVLVLPGGKALSGWADIRVNQGTWFYDATGAQRKPSDGTGAPLATTLLDTTGKQLKKGDPTIYIVYRPYEIKYFKDLGINP